MRRTAARKVDQKAVMTVDEWEFQSVEQKADEKVVLKAAWMVDVMVGQMGA